MLNKTKPFQDLLYTILPAIIIDWLLRQDLNCCTIISGVKPWNTFYFWNEPFWCNSNTKVIVRRGVSRICVCWLCWEAWSGCGRFFSLACCDVTAHSTERNVWKMTENTLYHRTKSTAMLLTNYLGRLYTLDSLVWFVSKKGKGKNLPLLFPLCGISYQQYNALLVAWKNQ